MLDFMNYVVENTHAEYYENLRELTKFINTLPNDDINTPFEDNELIRLGAIEALVEIRRDYSNALTNEKKRLKELFKADVINELGLKAYPTPLLNTMFEEAGIDSVFYDEVFENFEKMVKIVKVAIRFYKIVPFA